MPSTMLVDPGAATDPRSTEVVGAAANTRRGDKKNATASRNDFMCDLRSVVDDAGEAIELRATLEPLLPCLRHTTPYVRTRRCDRIAALRATRHKQQSCQSGS